MKRMVEIKDWKLARRMLAVEDPVEMKTEPGTEILIAAEDGDDEEQEMSGHWERDHGHSATENQRHRRRSMHILGVGEVI